MGLRRGEGVERGGDGTEVLNKPAIEVVEAEEVLKLLPGLGCGLIPDSGSMLNVPSPTTKPRKLTEVE